MIEIYRNSKNNHQIVSFPVGDFASNCTVIYNELTKEAFVFDPGFTINPVKELQKSENLNFSKIIHTHGHFDHITCSSDLKRQTNAKMYLNQGDKDFFDDLNQQASLFGISLNVEMEKIDELIDENTTFKLGNNGPEFVTIHTPGHSQGSCSFATDFFGFPLIIAGDTLFKHSIGRTDLPGGNHSQLLTMIKEKLFSYDDNAIVITGHGPTTTIGDEKKYNMYLR